MKKLILALCACLIPHALYAQTTGSSSVAPVQERQTSPSPQAELAEAGKLSETVQQLYAAGNYREALPQAERVLTLLEKVRTEDDPLVGSALNNLAVLYLALKDYKKAPPILERILARREKAKIATSPATMSLLISYICLTSARGVSIRGQSLKLAERINSILLQDAVLAAGLTLPDNLSELSSDIIASKPQPRYPGEAKSARLQGTVVVLGEADETGKVLNAQPVECWGGQKILAGAAAEAMSRARFKQVVVSGKAIRLKAIATYSFVLL